MNRRSFLATLAAPLFSIEKLPPVRAITRGPKFHWFGYYDKLQIRPDKSLCARSRGNL